MENLPKEIFHNIYLRLPLKDVFKSRVVSKKFSALLSNEQLKNTGVSHVPLRTTPVFLISAAYGKGPSSKSAIAVWDAEGNFNTDIRSEDMQLVVASSNGMYLMRVRVSASTNDEEAYKYYVCNPSSSGRLQVPAPPSGMYPVYGMHFDTETSFVSLLQVRLDDPDNENTFMDVYTSETQVWTTALIADGYAYGHSGWDWDFSLVYSGGCFFWVHFSSDCFDLRVGVFRVSDCSFHSIRLPRCDYAVDIDENYNSFRLCASDGQVFLLFTDICVKVTVWKLAERRKGVYTWERVTFHRKVQHLLGLLTNFKEVSTNGSHVVICDCFDDPETEFGNDSGGACEGDDFDYVRMYDGENGKLVSRLRMSQVISVLSLHPQNVDAKEVWRKTTTRVRAFQMNNILWPWPRQDFVPRS